jgi:hypothetical protein
MKEETCQKVNCAAMQIDFFYLACTLYLTLAAAAAAFFLLTLLIAVGESKESMILLDSCALHWYFRRSGTW